ncbi:ABC transporter permease [Candidatus Magnetomonas plexicatena]|uniref:ABC transporter permease n=1 Tax=Candidatus Magnetomonas plexicatena TaxID=2552947 RepID=UPI00110249CF|nr:ABC transporter permease [Nitrospirales bacterium LBB_01]
MLRFIIKKTAVVVLLVFGITLITFLLINMLPGDPAEGLVGQHAKPEDLERIRASLGVDKPIIFQYTGYVSLVIRGNLGRSYYSNRDVLDEILRKLPNTLALAASAVLLATVLGVLYGFLSGLNNGKLADRMLSTLSLAGISMPVFWSGLILMLVLSLKLKLLPPSGTGGLKFLILPAITLSLPVISSISRITRASVIETIDLPFVKVLKAKGLTHLRINFIHILKNTLIPVITVIGLDFASFLNGAVLTETIFGWDGIGRFTVDGILKRDYPVVLGCIITGTFIFVFINAAVDIIYRYVDPRVRVS